MGSVTEAISLLATLKTLPSGSQVDEPDREGTIARAIPYIIITAGSTEHNYNDL